MPAARASYRLLSWLLAIALLGGAVSAQEGGQGASGDREPTVEAQEDPWIPAAYVTPLGTLVAAAVAAVVAVLVNARLRRNALDQKTHEARLERYPELTKAAGPLALYFPAIEKWEREAHLTPGKCRAIGQAMSRWYFDSGGLLLSDEARDAYFAFARALTHAAAADRLDAPTFDRDARKISKELLDKYKKALKIEGSSVESWRFGSAPTAEGNDASAFRDYVLIQHLSSKLRTALTKDLESRRRPG
jgi:hypothetical protein